MSLFTSTVDLFGYTLAVCIFTIMLLYITRNKLGIFNRKKDSANYDIIDGKIIGSDNNISFTTFDDIIGLDRVKSDIKQYIDIFHNRDKYYSRGLEIPRGILLYGPPGCGKTSIAKALAYEAHVNFICRNASEVIENKEDIKTLFKYARKNSPCIIFIDEIDIIGSRGFGKYGLSVTRLLTEMDGFQKNDGVLIVGATNSIGSLDTALLRSGRFSKKFYIPNPTSKKDIIALCNLYKGGVDFEDGLSEDSIADFFSGYSPADIKALLNEVGIICSYENRNVTKFDLIKASTELNFNTVIVDNDIPESYKKQIAWHELGHTIMALIVRKPISAISIKGSNSGVAGFTRFQQRFTNDANTAQVNDEFQRSFNSVQQIHDELKIMLSGRIAELILFNGDINKVSYGCIGDYEAATNLAVEIAKYSLDSPIGINNLFFGDELNKVEVLKRARTVVESDFVEAKEELERFKPLFEYLVPFVVEREQVSGLELNNYIDKAMKTLSIDGFEYISDSNSQCKFMKI